MIAGQLRAKLADVALCLAFYTRLPIPAVAPIDGRERFADAQWAAPLAGAIVGLIGAGAYAGAFWAGLPVLCAAALAVAATMLVTGCLHEDGLCDTADGFGGGRTRERKLDIMRDSRIGAFGAAALILSVLLRCSALAAMAAPMAAAAVLVTAHCASRALVPAFMHAVAPARSDGLAARFGRPTIPVAVCALLLGGLSMSLLGPAKAACAAAGLFVLFSALARSCRRQIGGSTGDVLGALQQCAEIVVLLVGSAVFRSLGGIPH